MATGSGKKVVISGGYLRVFETFSFAKTKPEVVHSVLSALDFGEEELIVALPEGKAWRNKVEFRHTAKVLTVEIIYQASTNPISDSVRDVCNADADVVLEALSQLLEGNDVTGNTRSALPPQPQPQGGGGGGGRQGGGQGGQGGGQQAGQNP